MKLKQNLTYAFLSILFLTVTERYCTDIVCNMIDILSEVLKRAFPFPFSDEILRNMPHCFENYSDTRFILDCTEIDTQRPKKLYCQITTYSHYKSRHTLKFMTLVTPGGMISFVCKAYGGRASDKSIFEQSGLLTHLVRGTSIMIDKGFLIDERCSEYHVKLIRPVFLRGTNQFSATDALETADITSARVHVEKLIQTLKVFEILGTKIALCLVPKCEKIMTILSAI